MMAYKHQVSVTEEATGILTPVEVDSAIPVFFGTAPINMTDLKNINKPVMVYNYAEAVKNFGFVSANTETGLYDFTISEAIDVFFSKFAIAPVIFINVLDPETHKSTVDAEQITVVSGKATLAKGGILTDTLVITGEEPLAVGTDYEVLFNSKGDLIITAIEGGKLANGSYTVKYDHLDPSKVMPADVVGGVDVNGVASGLELVDQLFPMFRRVPANILAPKYSSDPAVAASMKAKANSITGLFKCQALIDVPTDTVIEYSKVAKWKEDNNITDPHQQVYWPMVSLSGVKYHLSTQAAAVMATTDSDNGDTPHKSPSNEAVQADSAVLIDGTEIYLQPNQAAEQLNGLGINTVLNFVGGWKAWGNNTAAYPGVTDVKDRWIAVRRMFNWVGNTIILTLWQELDDPTDRKQIDQITDTINLWLNSLQGTGAILGGRIEFRPEDNPTIELLNGKSKFRVFIAPPIPNEEIEVVLEYDPSYFDTLFD